MSDEFAPSEVLPEDTNEVTEQEDAANDASDTGSDPLAGVDVANDPNLPDPNLVVTIRTSGGETRYVPTTGSETVAALMIKAGLNMPAGFQIWYNGAELNVNDVVPAGSTLTVLTSVKGG